MVDTQQRDKLLSRIIMPAHQKVSPQQIVNAMLEWGGNVAAAAARRFDQLVAYLRSVARPSASQFATGC